MHYLVGQGKLEGMTTAAERLLVPGPEEKQLAGRAGTWTVIATMWPAPDAEPIVTDGLVAERVMIGLYLQETMRPAPGGTGPDFRRIDYLHYDRVEGRWKYVSMDTRLPVSIMPARSFGPAVDRTVRLRFEPLGFVGFGEEVGGTLMQSDMRITTHRPVVVGELEPVVPLDAGEFGGGQAPPDFVLAGPGEAAGGFLAKARSLAPGHAGNDSAAALRRLLPLTHRPVPGSGIRRIRGCR